ncbi:hypothetical protein [Candidatus Nitrosotalea bavarica]|jgi:hypothetical protein|uniref:hypothetical protein n=1 Tax=Candidatus Nitrosotalea bavarica TaxID=1903277 RepID=UPI000C6FE8F7|nr:hypothetical protein [Candidatus Nitrosotalea bavarica]
MSNQQIKVGLVAIVLTVVLVFASAALPAVNALTPSTVYWKHSQKTDRIPGGQNICGETLCSPDVWAKMKQSLHVAQKNPNVCSELKGWKYCGQQIVAPKTSTN